MTSAPRLTQGAVHPLRDLTLRTKQRDPRTRPEENFTYIDVSSISSDSLRIVQTSALLGSDAPSRARKAVRAGDVLFATVRPSLRRIALVPEELDGAICSTAFTVLRPKPEILDSNFLYFQAISEQFVTAVSALQRGSSYPAVSDSDVLSQALTIPPLEEQRRIARILSTIQIAKANSRSVSAALMALRKALFQTMMTGSPRWPTVRLGDEVTLQRGHDLPAQRRRQGQIPVISSSGVTGFHDEAKAHGPGVVIGRYGTLGSVTFVDGPYWPLNTTLYVKDFHGNNPSFVRFFLETIKYESHNDKTSVPGVNRNDLHAIQVSWPPLDEQATIATCLGSVESRIEVEASEEAAVQVIFASLLRKLVDRAK